jgi:hypothetical protein
LRDDNYPQSYCPACYLGDFEPCGGKHRDQIGCKSMLDDQCASEPKRLVSYIVAQMVFGDCVLRIEQKESTRGCESTLYERR